MTSTKFNISQAARVTKKSRNTITKHMENKTLSYELDAAGKRVIDASELIRAYGNEIDIEAVDIANTPPGRSRELTIQANGQLAHNDGPSIREALEREKAEREREREHYKSQIDHLQETLKLSQEGHNNATRLLENHSEQAGDWEKPLQALRLQVANQEKEQRETKNIARRYKKAYEIEKKKSWLQRLLGA